MHPLMPDISGITDSELQQKISQLHRVLRSNTNGLVAQQAHQILQMLLDQQQERYRQVMDKAVENNSKLSDSIDIS